MLIEKIKSFLEKYVFNNKWTCNCCGKEIFEGYFCKECYENLPFNDGAICDHCGRKVMENEDYCTTCKGKLIHTDKARSVFDYTASAVRLIANLKYKDKPYLADALGELLCDVYVKNNFSADVITFVPMTEKSKRKRGYNQSEMLAEALAKRLDKECVSVLEKTHETKRQATIGREERLVNLKEAFKVLDRKAVKDKKVLIVDDVTTTGSTAETIAIKLKKAGAKSVYLLTVASVAPKDKY